MADLGSARNRTIRISLNFLLHDSLGGGGIASVRIDPQGKGFAQMLLDIEIPVPADLAARDGLNAAARN